MSEPARSGRATPWRRVAGSVALGVPLASATAIFVVGGVLMARAAMQV